jgi:hypothetical protein
MNHFGGAGWNLQDAFYGKGGLMPEEVVPALAIRIETNAGKKDCP